MRNQNKRKTLNLGPIKYFDFHEIDLRNLLLTKEEMCKLKGKSPNLVSYLSKKANSHIYIKKKVEEKSN